MQHPITTVRLSVFASILLASCFALSLNLHAQAPNRATIAVASLGDGGTLWLMDTDGEQQEAIHDIEGDPVVLGLSWSPDGNKIAFFSEKKKNEESDVYVVDADGKTLRNLTDRQGFDGWPTWHPSGQRLAFTTDRDGNLEIYTMSAQGVVGGNLTNDAVPDQMPAWSPDGRKIAFATKRGKTLGDIWVMDSSGGNPQNLTDHRGQDIEPRFSFDSQKITWTTRRFGEGVIMAMDADGQNKLQISPNPENEKRDPAFSPDGKKIIYIRFGGGTANVQRRSVKQFAKGEPNLCAGDCFELPAIGFPTRSPVWFDPDFVVAWAVAPADKRPLTWGWIKQLGQSK